MKIALPSVIFAAAFLPTAFSAPAFDTTALPNTSPGLALNNVGSFVTAGFHYRNGTTNYPETDADHFDLHDLNDQDQVVGVAYWDSEWEGNPDFDYPAAFSFDPTTDTTNVQWDGWQVEKITNRGDVLLHYPYTDRRGWVASIDGSVVAPEDPARAVVFDLNNERQLLVAADFDAPQSLYDISTGTSTPLPHGSGDVRYSHVADDGTVFGTTGTHIAIYRNGTVSYVPTPWTGVQIHQINQLGQLVGFAPTGNPFPNDRLTFYSDGTNVYRAEELMDLPAGSQLELADINDLGQILGNVYSPNESGWMLFERSVRLDPDHEPGATVVSNATWEQLSVAEQTGRFVLSYEVTPQAANVDAVTGLSFGPADGYTDLATIVRFNTAGRIDVRNGNYYQAIHALNYEAGKTYLVVMTVDLPKRQYSVVVAPEGGAPVTLAHNFNFRTEQSGATALNTLNVFSVGGPVEVSDPNVDQDAPPATDTIGPIVSNGRWAGLTLERQAGTVSLLFEVTVSAKPVDAVVGVSLGLADGYEDLAANLRFNRRGVVDARIGAGYRAAQHFVYTANTTYTVAMQVNVQNHTYSATIRAPGGSLVTIANNYAFRSTQSRVAAVDSLNAHSSGGNLTVDKIEVE